MLQKYWLRYLDEFQEKEVPILFAAASDFNLLAMASNISSARTYQTWGKFLVKSAYKSRIGHRAAGMPKHIQKGSLDASENTRLDPVRMLVNAQRL